ncbi:MAG: VOC family protein [Chloroflexi bacterium]|nr:VOC family protein [Chloroflexota bacterium]
MALQLDHTIVPAYDKVKSAEFIARMFGLTYDGPYGHFAPVKVNDKLTLDFDDLKEGEQKPRSNHYAFLASDQEFDEILGRIKDDGIVYGSGPGTRTDGKINYKHQGRGFYFECENGHVWEVITHTYIASSLTN